MSETNHNLRSVIDRDGAVVLDIDSGTITTLNVTGAFIWQELRHGRSADAIITRLAERSGEPISSVAGDVRDFLEVLRARNLLPSKKTNHEPS